MTDSPLTYAIVIPALDCAATIESVVGDARRHAECVIVVDDGSSDDTSAIAEAAGATVLRNEVNLGKGASLRRAMEWLTERRFSHALSMDGDGQHLGTQVPLLVEASRRQPEALIVGERVFDHEIVSSIRLFGNRFANRWVEIACGRQVPDTQSGFRVYPIAATLALATRDDRFAFETEVLIRAVRGGLEVVGVPVETYYPPADERESQYRPFKDSLRIVAVVLRLILSR